MYVATGIDDGGTRRHDDGFHGEQEEVEEETAVLLTATHVRGELGDHAFRASGAQWSLVYTLIGDLSLLPTDIYIADGSPTQQPEGTHVTDPTQPDPTLTLTLTPTHTRDRQEGDYPTRTRLRRADHCVNTTG